MLTNYSQEETSLTLDSISHSAAQTQRIGMRLGELLQGGELILLDGKLGTGKTTFTQGLAQGMGITENINSPTFTLLKEYPGQLRPGLPPRRGPALYHFDLYRLDNTEEIGDLGFEDYVFSITVYVVERRDRVVSYWSSGNPTNRMNMVSYK